MSRYTNSTSGSYIDILNNTTLIGTTDFNNLTMNSSGSLTVYGTNAFSGTNNFTGTNAFSGTNTFPSASISAAALTGALPSAVITASNILTTNSVLLNSQLPQTITISGTMTAASFNATSDYRIKENVTSLSQDFTTDQLKPVTYYNTLIKKQDIGFLAHEVQEIYPFLVEGKKDDPEKNQSLNYIGLIGILIKEIQELKQWKEETDKSIQEMLTEIASLQ